MNEEIHHISINPRAGESSLPFPEFSLPQCDKGPIAFRFFSFLGEVGGNLAISTFNFLLRQLHQPEEETTEPETIAVAPEKNPFKLLFQATFSQDTQIRTQAWDSLTQIFGLPALSAWLKNLQPQVS